MRRRIVVLASLAFVPVLSGLSLPAADAGLIHPASSSFELDATAALSSTDVWAVGVDTEHLTGYDSASCLIVHFDGTKWTRLPCNTTGDHGPVLNSVTALSPTDVWAVGNDFSDTGGAVTRNLALHWDGSSWTEVTTPQPPTNVDAMLEKVTAISPTQVYAEEEVCKGLEVICVNRALLWDGHAWKRLAHAPQSRIVAASAGSATDAVAVGEKGPNDPPGVSPKPRSAHWDGKTWHAVRLPSQPYGGRLYDITTPAADDAWAVGAALDASGAESTPLILHWDGEAWTQVQGSDKTATSLRHVCSTSPADVWIGAWNGDTEHWDGTTWTTVANPVAGVYRAHITGLACVSSTSVWATATYVDYAHSAAVSVLMHWDGTSWSVVQEYRN